jgi:ElaB/YqjD/DUF883 family membrane-anchored ribosome-binding protein
MKMRSRPPVSGGESDPVTIDKLRDDLRVLAGDMEQLLKATASHTGRQIAQVRARAEESLNAAKVRIAEVQESALVKARAAGRATNEYVRENPWQVMAIAAGAGLALGFFLLAHFSDSSDSES